LICWDIVTSPSTPGSWIYSEEPSREQQMSESKIKNEDNLLKDSLNNFLLD
jgi:lipocalin